jgi:hypothetical protein
MTLARVGRAVLAADRYAAAAAGIIDGAFFDGLPGAIDVAWPIRAEWQRLPESGSPFEALLARWERDPDGSAVEMRRVGGRDATGRRFGRPSSARPDLPR